MRHARPGHGCVPTQVALRRAPGPPACRRRAGTAPASAPTAMRKPASSTRSCSSDSMLLQPARRQRGEALQETGAIARRCRCGAASARRPAACSRRAANASRGHGIGARLKYSASPLAARTSLTAFGIEQGLRIVDRRGQRRHLGAATRRSSSATARMPAAGANGSSPCRFTTMVSSPQPAMRAHSARRSVPEACSRRGHRDAHAAAARARRRCARRRRRPTLRARRRPARGARRAAPAVRRRAGAAACRAGAMAA